MRLVDIACEVIAETDKAFRIDDGDTRCWVPKSQVEWHEEKNGFGTMVMPENLAQEKGLI